jgi:hypothetical protein
MSIRACARDRLERGLADKASDPGIEVGKALELAALVAGHLRAVGDRLDREAVLM